jgi:small conductance mechanosensitive channel
MDYIAWIGDHSFQIILISGIVLFLLLFLRRAGLEKAIQKLIDKKTQKDLNEHLAKNPNMTIEEQEEFKDKRSSSYSNLYKAPFAIVSTIGILFLMLAIVSIWLNQKGEDELTQDIIGKWLVEHGTVIIVLIVVAYLITSFLKIIIPKLITKILNRRNKHQNKYDEEHKKRTKTIYEVIVDTLNTVIWVVVIFIILANIGLNITPLLASAGVVGIAISLGAQSLIKDVIAGLFIFIEGQYNEGDYVTIAGVSGTVEDINFRRTTVRANDGVLHSIPNGQISMSSNFTNEFSKATLKIPVSYDSDLDNVEKTLNKVGEDLANDEKFAEYFIAPIKFVRVDNLSDSSIDILVSGITKPGQQWAIQGEYRRRVKKAFEENGIELPYAHTNVIIEGNKNGAPVSITSEKCPYCGKPVDEKKPE